MLPGMAWLLGACILWSLSFGLIKRSVAGLDPDAVAATRLVLAAIAVAPWWRPGLLPRGLAPRLALVGAVQFGAMYLLYIRAFQHLSGHEVALLTAGTPLYVVLASDLLARRVSPAALGCAALAVAGGAVVAWRGFSAADPWIGIALVQAANLCFALGQVWWVRLVRPHPGLADGPLLAPAYLGAALTAAAACAVGGGWDGFAPDRGQWLALLYLGLVPTAVAFWMWNRGARAVGTGELAVANDAKIPLAVLCALLLFGESADPLRLTIGGAVIALALVLARRGRL